MFVKYIAVKILAVKLLKPPFGGFGIEAATWIRKWFKKSVGTSRKLESSRYNSFQGGEGGRGYIKYPGGLP
jgi:hypothetical protein